MRKAAVLLIVVFLFGCAAPRPRLNLNDTQAVAGQIITKRDDFKKHTEFKGPNAASDELFDMLFIRAWKIDGSDIAVYQIYVMDYYNDDWRFYSNAWDSNGTQLDTVVISREVESCSRYKCSHNEHIGINVTHEYLEKNQDTGIRFKISGKGGEEIFFIPSGYIKAFLGAVK